MRISTIGYCLKQGLKNIWRNKMFSLASVATMSICIFLFGLFFCVVQNFQYMVKEVESGVSVTVFFDEAVSFDQAAMDEIGAKIRARDEVEEAEFVSADQAWEEYKYIYFAEAPQLADGFANDNPLAKQAHYVIHLKDVEDQNSLVEYLESMEGIRKVNKSVEVAKILSSFNLLIGYVSVAIIILLLCVSVFLISNTVTIGIAVRKEEIAIMKLIGATNSFVKAPFVVEGLLIGLIGGAIPLSLLYLLYTRLMNYMGGQFNDLAGLIQFLPVDVMFQTLIPVGMALGAGIGFFGSYLTIRKHLRV
ncbi:permease-like cell division protein FtsX [Candidatus Merdisoma sp. JLR.KK006]|uniref:permease-like cell division protein FtsX n=1 Tax=Candidatus Merdisoma sp. JLR.KK006 TaxID=3112626 RepID=UPI002FF0CB3F